ncbi:MAG: LON peptidase substrate-binding domain-containing protein, partial [Pseudomonadales bacterium]
CMREGTGFGVVLIREGSEARIRPDEAPPEIFDFGTYARIVDFDQLPDGLLGIMGTGERKFRVIRTYEREDHLLMGEVEFLPDEPEMELPEEFEGLADLLRELLEHPIVKRLNLTVDLADARSVSWRLAELLPLEPEIKQSLLQLRHPRERLMELKRIIDNLQSFDGTARRH